MTTQILPDLILPSRVDQHWSESGLDSLSNCLDKAHFAAYPHPVEYNYNSRGFRDAEWPDDLPELKDAIWVFGDSFTVGVGSPINYTWPYAVAQELNKRVINISMDGASNEWIARRAVDVYHAVQPSNMIIMWSYFHRRESTNIKKFDEDKRLHASTKKTDDLRADVNNFFECMNKVACLPVDCIHFVIPYAVPGITQAEFYQQELQAVWDNIKGNDWPDQVPTTKEEYQQLPQWIIDEIRTVHCCDDRFAHVYRLAAIGSTMQQRTSSHYYYGSVPRLDIARDGHHFDILSSQWVAAAVAQHWQLTHD